MKVLLKFDHGLGDCVQFTSVLQHLRKHKPDWKITLLTNAGKHSTAIGLCERSTSDREIEKKDRFDKILSVQWYECHDGYEGMPCTKVERCLREEFKISPEIGLLGYKQVIRDEARFAAEAYFRAIGARILPNGRWNVLILHYQGNTSTEKKNINHDIAKLICDRAIFLDHIPIILDWDKRSPLPDGKTIFCPDADHPLWNGLGTGDAERIAALISLSNLCVSIDSGPGHIAGATHTPTAIIWDKHHPIHYYAPCSNVQHLIPHNHLSFIRKNQEKVFPYFNNNYRYIEYKNLAITILEWIDNMSGGQIEQTNDNYLRSGDFWIRRDNAEQDMVIVRDIYDEDSYRLRLIPGIISQAKLIVDIGAHIGCFAKLVHKLNPSAQIICVEVCPENIEYLQKNVGGFAKIIQAACTYDEREMMLLNAVRPNCESTGGSVVIPKTLENTNYLRQPDYQYWSDERQILKVTLEQIMKECGVDKIDLLKLDCEGAEFSILENTVSLDRIRFIVGEYHKKDDWIDLKSRKFPNWDYGQMYVHQPTGLGIFHLANRIWPPEQSTVISCLRQYIKSGDDSVFNQNISWYQCIYDVCSKYNPQKVVEFGIRAGYSARAVLEACPKCKLIGYEGDIDEPSKGFWKHAEKIVPGFEIHLKNTFSVFNIEWCDLVLVDADHSFDGCSHELTVASIATTKILVDDYGENAEVKRAVDLFISTCLMWTLEILVYSDKKIAFLTRDPR